jgi:hypothetical protein
LKRTTEQTAITITRLEEKSSSHAHARPQSGTVTRQAESNEMRNPLHDKETIVFAPLNYCGTLARFSPDLTAFGPQFLQSKAN